MPARRRDPVPPYTSATLHQCHPTPVPPYTSATLHQCHPTPVPPYTSATLHYHSTVLLLTSNRKPLMKWLKSISFKERKQVMDNAKRNGKLLRAMHRRLLILCHWIPFIPKYFFLSSKAIDFCRKLNI